MTIAYMVRQFDMMLHDTAFEDIPIMIDYGLGLSKHGELRVFTKVTYMLWELCHIAWTACYREKACMLLHQCMKCLRKNGTVVSSF
jgi:hypothetical protein